MSEKLHSNDNKAREQKCIKACRLRQRIVDKGGDSMGSGGNCRRPILKRGGKCCPNFSCSQSVILIKSHHLLWATVVTGYGYHCLELVKNVVNSCNWKQLNSLNLTRKLYYNFVKVPPQNPYIAAPTVVAAPDSRFAERLLQLFKHSAANDVE